MNFVLAFFSPISICFLLYLFIIVFFLLHTFSVYISTFALLFHYLSKIADWQSKAHKLKLSTKKGFF